MTDTESKSSAKRAVDTLTRQNHELWFKLLKQWFIGEGLWEVIDPDNAPDATSMIESAAPSAASSYGKILTNTLGYQNGAKLDARAQYQLLLYISTDDMEYVAEETRVRGIWMKLLTKYKKKLKTVERQTLTDLLNYQKNPALDIQATYTEITKMSRKVAEFQPDLSVFTSANQRFQILLKCLPKKDYGAIRDAFDAQADPDIETFMMKLEKKETQLIADKKKMTMLAKGYDRKDGHKHDHGRERSAYRIPQRRSSSSQSEHRFSKSKTVKKSCFLCGENHFIRDCKYVRKLRKLIKIMNTYKDKKEGKQKVYNIKDSEVKDKLPSASSSEKSLVIDSDNETNLKKIAALSKKLVSTVPKSDWIADTGATSHMTDQLQLFSEPLKSIRRRTIRVGEGRLYSDQCETVIMRVNNDECRLTDVLYVPELGVNLLSGRRFTKCGLRESFNNDELFMHTKKGIEVLRAPARSDIYIVDKVTFKLDEFAYPASIESELVSTVSTAIAPSVASNSKELLSNNESQMDISSNVEPQAPKPQAEPSTDTAPKKRDLYTLWHRRLGHLGSAKLRNLHKVTTLKKPIPIVEAEAPCEVYAITKMTNKRNRTLAERRPRILALVFVDICGPLPTSRLGFEYFLKIVDNWSRRTWHLPLIKRSNASKALRQWKLKVKLQSSASLQAVRSDNAKKLKSTLDE